MSLLQVDTVPGYTKIVKIMREAHNVGKHTHCPAGHGLREPRFAHPSGSVWREVPGTCGPQTAFGNAAGIGGSPELIHMKSPCLNLSQLFHEYVLLLYFSISAVVILWALAMLAHESCPWMRYTSQGVSFRLLLKGVVFDSEAVTIEVWIKIPPKVRSSLQSFPFWLCLSATTMGEKNLMWSVLWCCAVFEEI